MKLKKHNVNSRAAIKEKEINVKSVRFKNRRAH